MEQYIQLSSKKYTIQLYKDFSEMSIEKQIVF